MKLLFVSKWKQGVRAGRSAAPRVLGAPVCRLRGQPTTHQVARWPYYRPSLDDTTDFANAERGFIAGLSPGVIKDARGRVVWDSDAYGFLDGPSPLDRQPQPVAAGPTRPAGRGGHPHPLARRSLRRRARGGAGRCQHPGHRPGRLPRARGQRERLRGDGDDPARGLHVRRRGTQGAGQIGAGLGLTTSTDTISLIPPTLDITRTGREEVVGGVRIVFQLTPGTEAPSEMNFYFPDSGCSTRATPAWRSPR
jgi:hypothetical protein